MKTKILSLILTLFTVGAFAQVPQLGNSEIVNGYSQKIAGNNFSYTSSIPGVKECLLIRATNGKSTMEWETAPAPKTIKGNFVTFVWLAGLGSSPGRACFDLQINGIKKFSFWVDNLNEWQQTADDGSTLSFQKNGIDHNGDRYGFNFGYNAVKVNLPRVEKSKIIRYKLSIADFIDEGKITVNPVKKWQVNFVQHTHTDIGYTRPQTEILAEHLRYIDYALDYCDNNALLFYTEHTVGYHGSVREPFSENTMEQRAIKESYAWEAGRRTKMIGEETMGLVTKY
ncbi:MAG: hypothetical protein J7L95_03190 [Prolixibacteraceae bacterium]|nr:hypothetical protein [Prolixibacteraceae bacterium]